VVAVICLSLRGFVVCCSVLCGRGLLVGSYVPFMYWVGGSK
jgi:hypothetical protein